MQNLVIVESPTKAKTLSKYLGSKYQVEASMGHIRDLPKSDIGVDTEHNFQPKYIIPRDKTKRVNQLKKLAAQAKNLWLATDPDREGEAIAWHLNELLRGSNSKLAVDVKRVVFHEITPEAIKEAFEEPRNIDLRLVDAQQARRVLDRLVGYKLSPLLWKKVKSGLSAGRVQSVALRLIVDREKEITIFKPQEYWSIDALLEHGTDKGQFVASLVEKDHKKLTIKSKTEADGHLGLLEKAEYKVAKVTQKEVKKYPAPPFTTSTMQQASSLRLGYSAKKTMMIAQALYEHGLITYMRTDSFNLSPQALTQARSYIQENLGKSYLPPAARVYKTKSKLAQEAHEAIRPTDVRVTGEKLSAIEGLSRDHLRLYELIWKRMIASQIADAVMDQTTIDISAGAYTFRATGSVVKFDGWMKIYGGGPASLQKINPVKT
ncbi:MAG: type I DNA topoisomerase [Patescibacteria group bacterium]|nr:type I DNA topoisomerase [Patescibacteria group bacterium]